jgi:hypothetical protein
MHLAPVVLREVVHVGTRMVEVLVASVPLVAGQVALGGARRVAA